MREACAAALFVVGVLVGTVLDRRAPLAVPTAGIVVADLHVHPYPGDGALTVWQLQREARRRGIDALGITGHNNRVGLTLSKVLGTDAHGPVVIAGQEVTTPAFHMIVLGTKSVLDWRATAADTIGATHAQGGVAIAAHPSLSKAGWDERARRALDGSEVMHPQRLQSSFGGLQLDEFFARTAAVRPTLAAIGSTDFHMAAPLGLCRTYLVAAERTAEGVIGAVRDGRTVARCGEGPLVGRPEHVAFVQARLGARPAPTPSGGEKLAALLALAGLVLAAVPSRTK